MHKDVTIIGAGVAGLHAALELSQLGLSSLIIDRADAAGGHVSGFCCKATQTCQRCGACTLEEMRARVAASSDISRYWRSTVSDISRQEGLFRLKMEQRPAANGPESDPEEVFATSSALILATGFKPFDPLERPRLGYGRVPGVVTGLELEAMLRSETWKPNGSDGVPGSVAFIQCVGSRDTSLGRNYCSQVCCAYAMRLARMLRHRYPEVAGTIFYMDIQTFDRDFEARIERAGKELRLIRSIPADVKVDDDGRPLVIYQGPDDNRVSEPFDTLVLSIGITPETEMAGLLGLELDEDGFMRGNGDGTSTAVDGVLLAGTARGPGSIADTLAHASAAAVAAAEYVDGATVRRSQ